MTKKEGIAYNIEILIYIDKIMKKIILVLVIAAGLYFTFVQDIPYMDNSIIIPGDTSIVSDDLTNKAEVFVNLQDFSFVPRNIKISKGTKITWINKDSAMHSINSDKEPIETYIPELNSELFGKDGSFSFVMDNVGTYPYHCAPHARNMRGIITVE